MRRRTELRHSLSAIDPLYPSGIFKPALVTIAGAAACVVAALLTLLLVRSGRGPVWLAGGCGRRGMGCAGSRHQHRGESSKPLDPVAAPSRPPIVRRPGAVGPPGWLEERLAAAPAAAPQPSDEEAGAAELPPMALKLRSPRQQSVMEQRLQAMRDRDDAAPPADDSGDEDEDGRRSLPPHVSLKLETLLLEGRFHHNDTMDALLFEWPACTIRCVPPPQGPPHLGPPRQRHTAAKPAQPLPVASWPR